MTENSGSSVVRCAIYLRSACDDAGSLAEQEAICRAAMRVQKATLLNGYRVAGAATHMQVLQ